MISICATNYNCAHALPSHLRSVFEGLAGLDFEYIVVDNRSKDGSLEILRSWAESESNMTVLSKRSTIGRGRQISFSHSKGEYVMTLDTDVIYSSLLRSFVDAYFDRFRGFCVQAVFCGIFPRDQWTRAGGRRSLNTNEDVDLWTRLNKLGTIRWYPISLGENVKEIDAWGRGDYLSRRYSRFERLQRLLRREWDLWKTREIEAADLALLIEPNIVDFGLGARPIQWPQDRTPRTFLGKLLEFSRGFRQVLTSP